MSTTYVDHLEFWKILYIRVHFPFSPYPAGTYIVKINFERGEEGN